MSPRKNEFLLKEKISEDVFEYQGLEQETADTYAYFDVKFKSLFQSYAEGLFDLKNCVFYIKSDDSCNAFASKNKGYNIIGITSGYPILMKAHGFFDRKSQQQQCKCMKLHNE